jgi:hypothetical protein
MMPIIPIKINAAVVAYGIHGAAEYKNPDAAGPIIIAFPLRAFVSFAQ